LSDEDDDLDDPGRENEEVVEAGEVIKPSLATDIEARRRLEAKLEERRLNKMIQDYDFDDSA